ncbi:MAG: FKBP-type peptidyl-prolyl cis-trans isomerase [Polyangiaceae bacterium]
MLARRFRLLDMQIQANAFVTLHCRLEDAAGVRLDEGDEPIEYVHGYSILVPGLENALVGLKVGDEKNVVVNPEDGFGDRDEELMLEVDRSEFPKHVEPGDELVAESDDGEEAPMIVIEVREDSVVVDANHPYAGKTLHYHVRVVGVREASATEIEEAAAEYDESHHVHDENCGHAHAQTGTPELIQLGTKQQKVLN